MNTYTFLEIQTGMTESFTRRITAEMEDAFREISGDENPFHKDDTFAKEIGEGKFRSHVTFGMLTASLFSAMAGLYLPGKYSLIHSINIKFLKPVFAGDTLTVTGTVVEKEEALRLLRLKVKVINQDHQCVSKADMKVLVLK